MGKLFTANLEITFLYLLVVTLSSNVEEASSTKCSYSFVINEMDPSNCPCLLDQGDSVVAKTWIPPKESSGAPDADGIQSDDKSNSITTENFVSNEEAREMREKIEELQKKYDSLYVKTKDLEIKMYKESVHNLELHSAMDKQEQTLEDYRFITERIKKGLDKTAWDIDKHKLQMRTQMDLLERSVDSNTDTLEKHNEYLMSLERPKTDTAAGDRRLDDPVIDRTFDESRQKNIPVKSAPEETCDGISKNATKYKDCEELYERGHKESGVYYITPRYTPCPIPVYCDMQTEGGGWLVFQRRQDGSQNFTRNWTDYRRGFGDLNGEFWLGNDNIFLLTNQASYKLRIDVWDFNATHRYAQYLYFTVGGERDKYRLMVLNHTGNMRDGLDYHNGMLFSTPDEDNDSWGTHHCAREWGGGWWFNKCWFVMLNGWYFHSPNAKYKGIAWNQWKREQLQRSEMKIKSSDYM